MKTIRRYSFVGLGFSLLVGAPATAQIAPDATLGTERSVVTPNQSLRPFPVDVISGGATRGANLFHSFTLFNINAGRGAYFANPTGIQNILTRVTGNAPSSINGTLGVLGNANLFLINPNGILFGPTAALDLRGSFVGSSATSIQLADGTQYSAQPTSQPPLLTNNAPIGLNFSQPAGSIQVQGIGNTLINPIFAPLSEAVPSSGLSVDPGKTIALIGGPVSLNGGILKAPSGNIELGSVNQGFVGLAQIPTGFKANYGNGNVFNDLQLANRSQVEASGVGGTITLQGRQINLNDGSAVLIRNLGGDFPSGITVNASEGVALNGTSPTGAIASTLLTENLGSGRGGDITVSTAQLNVLQGGQILARTFGLGTSGNLSINASESVNTIGFAPAYPNLFSNISAATFGLGNAGNLQLSTKNLQVTNGSQIGSATFGSGSGGSVTVNASDILLNGIVPNLFTPGAINAATFNSGSAGQLTVNTDNLRILNGARLGTSTVASGNAGNLIVSARKTIEVAGEAPGAINPSLIDSSANLLNPALQQQLRVPASPTGNSGDVTLNAGRLILRDGGLVSVRNDGPGNAGTLRINAETVSLNNRGGISASTNGGNGGNIQATVNGLLSLQDQSAITATARNFGSGGNIQLNSGVVAVLRNSTISANAQRGRGGAIAINAQGIYRSPDSTISATSDLPEFSGIVQLNTTQPPVDRGTVRTRAVPPVPRIAAICQSQSTNANELTNNGLGGFAINPNGSLTSDRGWLPPNTSRTGAAPSSTTSPQLVEAQGWLLSPDRKTLKLVVFGTQSQPRGLIAQSCKPFFKTTAHR